MAEKFELLYQAIWDGLNPSFAAIAVTMSISKPFGFVTVVPRTVPTWKPTAGRLRPTVRTPDFLVGGGAADAWIAAPAVPAASATAATAPTATVSRFTGRPPEEYEAANVPFLSGRRKRLLRPVEAATVRGCVRL